MTGLPPIPGVEGAESARYFSLGRHALVAGFKMLGIGRGDAILLPGFICRDLLAALHTIEVEPLFYPVEKSLIPLTLPVGPRVKAVLAVNYFGFPQALDPFRAYTAACGAVLVEDNAHGFLSRDAQGILLGRRGDLGVTSLRKTFAIPDGAVLLANRKDLAGRLPDQEPCVETALPAAFVAKRVLGRVQSATGVRVRSLAESATRGVRRARTGHAFPVSPPEAESRIPGDAAIHCESLRMLGKIDAEHEVNRRRVLYQRFQKDLRHLDIEPVFPELAPGVAPYGFPFRAAEAEARRATRIARAMGFDCSRWPDLPAAVAPSAPVFYGNVFWVNFLC